MQAAKQTIDIPMYVDTKTPRTKWYLFNAIIGLASLLMAYLAFAFLEYEIAKLTHPRVAFLVTPIWLDLAVSATIIGLAISNLAVLIFVFMRHLWLRRWMIATTILGWMLIAALGIILNARFLMILFPWYRP